MTQPIQIKLDEKTYSKIQKLALKLGNLKMATTVKILINWQLNELEKKNDK